jgi:hypothetical protein
MEMIITNVQNWAWRREEPTAGNHLTECIVLRQLEEQALKLRESQVVFDTETDTQAPGM